MPIRWRELLPDFPSKGAWVNGERTKAQLTGKPTLVHFWAASCKTCREGLPLVNEWHRTYGGPDGAGLQTIGVHVPRTAEDEDVGAAAERIVRYAISHPVLLDGDRAAAAAFRNECVPAYYVFDRAGRLRHYQTGERGLGLLEQRIRKLLSTKESE
ncbi:redoxin family protein [Paenibacillus sp.]|uniref:redoxin family protein n=1 Tax=Paenibacillus sp. TaxID=58172 RepID=UPI002810D14D|nr:redoxin family protein [Paenibacillus sp.]